MNQHSRNPQRLAKARTTFRNFFRSGKRTLISTGVWKNITDADMDSALLDRIINPEKIAQKLTSTCGPAAYWYSLAYYRPEVYAKAVIELYDQGKTTLGNLVLQPSQITLNALTISNRNASGSPRPTIKPSAIDPVDWIALGSLKNATSKNYDDVDDELSAITMPNEVAIWLTKTGWSVHNQVTSTASSQPLIQLKAASLGNWSGRAVCLFIKAKSAGNVKRSLWWGADHWVILTSPIEVRASSKDPWVRINSLSSSGVDISNYQVQFWIYTWGRYIQVGANNMHNPTISISKVSDFLDYFYGYLSCSPPR